MPLEIRWGFFFSILVEIYQRFLVDFSVYSSGISSKNYSKNSISESRLEFSRKFFSNSSMDCFKSCGLLVLWSELVIRAGFPIMIYCKHGAHVSLIFSLFAILQEWWSSRFLSITFDFGLLVQQSSSLKNICYIWLLFFNSTVLFIQECITSNFLVWPVLWSSSYPSRQLSSLI